MTDDAEVRDIVEPETETETTETAEVDATPEPIEKTPYKAKTRERMADLLKARAEYRERAEKAEAELARLKKPTLEDADHDIEKYVDSASEYNTQAMEAKVAREKTAELDRSFQESLVSAWKRIRDEAITDYPDLDTVFAGTPVSATMAELIVDSQKPADIAMYLGRNKEEAAEIYKLPPHLQGRELARIEAKLLMKPKVSKTPEPVTSRPTGGTVPKKDWLSMSDDEFSKTMNRLRRGVRDYSGM